MTDNKIEEAKEFTAPTASSPTFVIKVLFRQNATWQGSIQWLEGKQTRQFRSEFEMLKLMDEAMQLTAHEQNDEPTTWDQQ